MGPVLGQTYRTDKCRRGQTWDRTKRRTQTNMGQGHIWDKHRTETNKGKTNVGQNVGQKQTKDKEK